MEEVTERGGGGRTTVAVVCAVRSVVGRVKVKPGHWGVVAHVDMVLANLRRPKLSRHKLAPYL
jgi:hypothetical protein